MCPVDMEGALLQLAHNVAMPAAALLQCDCSDKHMTHKKVYYVYTDDCKN